MQETRFWTIRRHLFTKTKVPRKGLSAQEIYQRRKKIRIERSKLAYSQEGKEFYAWMDEIQKKLQLDNKKFAEFLGIKLQTLYSIKEKRGHFPSHQTFDKLFELERLSTLTIEVK